MPYADTTYADHYFALRLGAPVWIAAEPEKRAQALETASDALDAWAMRRGGWRSNVETDPPDEVKRACCIEALELLSPEANARRQARRDGVTSISIGGASESYRTETPGVGDLCCAQTAALLRRYVRGLGGAVIR